MTCPVQLGTDGHHTNLAIKEKAMEVRQEELAIDYCFFDGFFQNLYKTIPEQDLRKIHELLLMRTPTALGAIGKIMEENFDLAVIEGE